MNILTVSTLYPNNLQPRHGIFVETRLRKLKQAYPQCNITVLAPIPWFPFSTVFPAKYPQFSAIEQQQSRHGISIYHPAYLALPGLGMYCNPWTLYRSLKKQVMALVKQGRRFDIVDAHYIYPDAVAAVWLAQELGLPITATARGSDINLLPRYTWPRALIRRALAKVDVAIGVCQALTTQIRQLQPAVKQSITIRNGVDTALYYPLSEREQLRSELGYKHFCLLSVGNLVALKGHDKTIALLTQLPDAQLFIAGEGPLLPQLQAQVKQLGLSQRVHFLGYQTQQQLHQHYNAADCLVLASSSEGWANVLLEAMACGCPVVATPAGGTPEVVAHPHAGVLSTDFSADALLSALLTLQQNMPARDDVSAYASTLSWDQSIVLLKQTFDTLVQQHGNGGLAEGKRYVR